MSLLSNLFQKGSESDSTSLSEQIQSLEWIEATRDAAIQLWKASLMSMSDAMPQAPKQITDPHRKSLRQLAEELPPKPAPAVFEQKKQKTSDVLKSYGSQMGTFIESQDREARAVLTSVAQLTEALSGFDQRYAVRFQGITKKLRALATSQDLGEIRAHLDAEVSRLEQAVDEQQRDTRMAIQRLNEDVSSSELRRQKSVPGPASQHGSDALLVLERAAAAWDRYCLVRYEFFARPGLAIDAGSWQRCVDSLTSALPERVGANVRVVTPKPGLMFAAVHCQLLEYAGRAEAMEQSLSQLSGAICNSRVVEPLRGETMREAMARLEKAG